MTLKSIRFTRPPREKSWRPSHLPSHPRTFRVKANSLRIVNISNGWALYGTRVNGEEVFLAHLGDTKPAYPKSRYEKAEWAEAYHFRFLSKE